ncbi:transglycosylase domain-containing protein [Galbitalea sp. SE-J8]|uniref:transglycosylase domain-containing protein n=1 Tax=Galbitalea sp. SE-J8 TaxID=3054952 RepID=UPI00259D2DB9|nr:transglycosylase domain-containing protein [Galbitalea sp. SE-J8]MDM4763592.1 transglycosylase domain-containing protein [Galbitalea sp. SE-J8]
MAAGTRRPSAASALLGVVGLSAIAGLLASVALVPGLAVASVAASNATDIFENLPSYVAQATTPPQQNRIMAISGTKDDGTPKYTQIATVYFQNRIAIPESEVTDLIKHATLAAEDVRFYQHGAVDPQGILRALVANVGGGDLQGASTLTQQLVKNLCITDKVTEYPEASQEAEKNKAIREDCQDPSIDRKLKEMKSAIGLEKSLSKDEILLAYLNIAGFGGNVYGIESAAERYYSTTTDKLTVAQAASLVGIVQSPGERSLDNPAHYEANQARRDHIIRVMADQGWITTAERDEALATPVDDDSVHLAPATNGCIVANQYARQFCDYITRSVKDFTSLGDSVEERQANWKIGGYTVYTTLDLRLNKTAQGILRQWAPIKETQFKLGASLVSIEPGTGRILAMAQNKKFDNRDKADGGGGPGTSAINFNTDFAYGGSSGFQPGSGYKLFTLLNWLEQGHGLNEIVDVTRVSTPQADFTDSCNGPYTAGSYSPRNDSNESGYYSVRDAMAQSINGGFVQMALQLDLCETRRIALALGMHRAALLPKDRAYTDMDEATDLQALSTIPASILGVDEVAPMTLAAAYATIAANGTFCEPIAVDKFERAGQELPGQAQDCTVAAVDPEVAAAAASAMQTGASRYAGNPHDGTPLIAKTGTTNSSKQTWLTMGSTKLMTTIWYGNISGNFPIRSYCRLGCGGQQRHPMMKAYLTVADKMYGGDAFPEAPERLLKGINVKVGDYVGMSPEDAKAAIESLGMVYSEEDDTVASAEPAGTIGKQLPPEGSSLSKGQKIRVFISDGSKSTVPDLLSTPTDEGAADAAITAAGLVPVSVCRATPTQVIDPATGQPNDPNLPTEGRVVDVSTAAGTVLTKGKTVTITVAHAAC